MVYDKVRCYVVNVMGYYIIAQPQSSQALRRRSLRAAVLHEGASCDGVKLTSATSAFGALGFWGLRLRGLGLEGLMMQCLGA